jgi:uracil-DNA glycosylase
MSVSVAHGRPSDKIESLRREAAACQACPLWKDATQTVFGEGPADAEIMFVGEQPGIEKTVRAVHSSGRRASYWRGRWQRRAWTGIALTLPTRSSTSNSGRAASDGCINGPTPARSKYAGGWLFDEIEAIRPRLIVALEATAPQSLAGRAIPVQTNRGKILDVENGLRVFVTIHPSALLRLQDDEERRSDYASFVNDLRSIEQLAGAPANQANAEVSKADSFSLQA